MENKAIVTQHYPQAIAERQYGDSDLRGFMIWSNPWKGCSTVDLLGHGKTEELAWIHAAKNVQQPNSTSI